MRLARSTTRRLLGCLFLGFCLLALGCSGDNFQKVYPVSGKVFVDGQPAHECMVTLNRTFDDAHPRKVIPYGMTDANGEYKVSSYLTDDGAPEGEYIITIEWKMRSGVTMANFEGPDRLDGAYANKELNKTKPEYVIKVGRGPLVLPDFKLTQPPNGKKRAEEYERRKKAGTTLMGDK